MSKVSKSPERNTFQKEGYLKRQAEKGKTPENDEDTRRMLEWYDSWTAEDDAWAEVEHKNDLEYDLRTCDWILEKVRAADYYAQNVYAAMCNMQWQKLDTFPILKEERWSCTWRSAGGIVANMRMEGDYMDWYCSGMGGVADYDTDPEEWAKRTGYVPESHVTEEIRADFQRLGWVPVPWDDED